MRGGAPIQVLALRRDIGVSEPHRSEKSKVCSMTTAGRCGNISSFRSSRSYARRSWLHAHGRSARFGVVALTEAARRHQKPNGERPRIAPWHAIS